jgi:hypothetical protein
MTHSWAAEIVATGIVRADLEGASATLTALDAEMLRHSDCTLIAFYGHGLEDSLLGQPVTMSNPTPIVGVSNSSVFPSQLAGRKLYAVACLAGSKLGPALRSINCEFIGYSEALVIPRLFENECKSIVNEGIVKWASGTSAQAVYEKLRELWLAMAKSCGQKGSKRHINLSHRSMAGAFAYYNREAVCCYI